MYLKLLKESKEMIREEAIEMLEDLDGAIEDNQGRDYDEAFRMAIEALSDHSGEVTEMVKKDLTSDGTLKVNVSDASKVKRVMVWGENSGGLYYLDEGCDKCKYFPFSEESNVQKMHDGDRPNRNWSIDDTDYCSGGEEGEVEE